MSIRDFVDADGNRIQPYYAAYMVAHGLDRPDGRNVDYMEWIQRMWRESGVEREPSDHPGFLTWLEAEVAS